MQTLSVSRHRKGFTLIELLIVITIVGILAVALVPRITQGPARARDVKRKADLQNIAAALELYYSDKGKYPGSVDALTETCLTGSDVISTDIKPYLQGNNVPLDQGGLMTNDCPGQYYYAPLKATSGSTTPSAYMLASNLETDTTSGDGIYCGFAGLTTLDSTTANSTLVKCTGTGVEDAFYVVSR